MIESIQILLIIVIAILTILLMIVGIQVFLILKELRCSIERVNKILNDAGKISESFVKPLSSLSEISGLM